MGNKIPEEEKSKINKISIHTFKSIEEKKEYEKNYYVGRIVEYDEYHEKWIGYIDFIGYRHEIGFYDTRDEAIDRVLEKLKNAFGEMENKPFEHYFSMRFCKGGITL
jgi:CRISPR/Cas system CMR-associated protein Cmr5 small subunit